MERGQVLVWVLALWLSSCAQQGCIARAAAVLRGSQLMQQHYAVAAAPDPLANVQQLAEGLYLRNNLSTVDQYCVKEVVVHGDGVWQPRTPFVGIQWIKQIHRDWFQAYTGWDFRFIELCASSATKGFTEVFGFFHWQANNTGSWRGLSPSLQVSPAYGILHATTDKAGMVTDVYLWRQGFQEEREVLLRDPTPHDLISPIGDILERPFWSPSQSVQLKMMTRAHNLIEVLNQGEKFLDSLDDICMDNVMMLDGLDVWGPGKLSGLTDLKLWMARWLQMYDCSAAVTGTAATPTSNKVFLSFKLTLSDYSVGSSVRIEGVFMYVFNIQGFITHLVLFRNGTPKEEAAHFISGSVPSLSSSSSSSGGGSVHVFIGSMGTADPGSNSAAAAPDARKQPWPWPQQRARGQAPQVWAQRGKQQQARQR